MRDRLPQIIILSLLIIVVGLPFLLKPKGSAEVKASATASGLKLVIMTPHNEQIRVEFARAYNENRAARGLDPVTFDWRTGGTSELARTAMAQGKALAEKGREERGIGVDLFWGGGTYDHDSLARGPEITRGEETINVPVSVPFSISEDLLSEAFPVRELAGLPLLHEERRWIGVAFSSFGIVYNRDRLQRLDMSEPQVWGDLGATELLGEVALADPTQSGSIAATYNALLKRTGWIEGWHTLRRAFANARFFAASSTRVPMDVGSGEAAAGMCIDFYGRFQAGASPDDAPDGGARVAYVDPVRESALGLMAITNTEPDPISLMRAAPHMDLANDFTGWLLSQEAQSLWQLKLGAEGGPGIYQLRRQPIRRDVYDHITDWTDPEIQPFATAAPMPPGTPDYFSLVRGLTRAVAIDNHQHLRRAWEAIIEAGPDHPRYAEMIAAFDRMPEELTLVWPSETIAANWWNLINDPEFQAAHAASPDEPVAGFEDAYTVVATMEAFNQQIRAAYPRPLRDAKELEWTLFFRDNYERVVELAR